MAASDWVYLPTPSGAFYYANLATGESSWERPAELDTGALPSGHGGEADARRQLGGGGSSSSGGSSVGASFSTGTAASSSSSQPATPRSQQQQPATPRARDAWVEFWSDEHGQAYYYNEVTEETAWVIPADEDDDVDADEDTGAGAAAGQQADAEEESRRSRRAARRIKILEEILTSERAYVASLRTLMKVYLEPLRMVADVPRGAIFSHADLDAIFLNIAMILTKINEKFLEELEAEHAAHGTAANFAPIITATAKNLKGAYTRYVNNFEEAEATLLKIARSDNEKDREKHRYLVGAAKHPDANGHDLRSFLIMPVQRVPRYRMLLEDLIAHTDEHHVDAVPLKEALEKIAFVANHTNKYKGQGDDYARLRTLLERFADSDAVIAELLRTDRRVVKEGRLTKARQSHRQGRHIFLFNDVLVYAASGLKGFVKKGTIELLDGARIASLPRTEEMPYAFAISKGGKGYTWLAETLEEKEEWLRAIEGCISAARPKASSSGGGGSGPLDLSGVKTKPLQARIFAVQGGGPLVKYNMRDGKSNTRWVMVDRSGEYLRWGDPKTKECKSDSKVRLQDAHALHHGTHGGAFHKAQGARKDRDHLCFSIVCKGRTIDFAARDEEQLFDWYLALASFIPHSSETLLDEAGLRQRIEQMAT